jgi:hypothetical protein
VQLLGVVVAAVLVLVGGHLHTDEQHATQGAAASVVHTVDAADLAETPDDRSHVDHGHHEHRDDDHAEDGVRRSPSEVSALPGVRRLGRAVQHAGRAPVPGGAVPSSPTPVSEGTVLRT